LETALILGEIWNLKLKKKVILDSLKRLSLNDGTSGEEKTMDKTMMEKLLELTGYPSHRLMEEVEYNAYKRRKWNM